MSPGQSFKRVRALVLPALAAAIVIAPAAASAQSGAIDQYLPPGHHPTGARGGPVSGGRGGGASGGASASAAKAGGQPAPESGASLPASDPGPTERGGGSLPAAGYPLTPLVLVVLVLAATAVTIRLAIEARRRLAAGRTPTA